MAFIVSELSCKVVKLWVNFNLDLWFTVSEHKGMEKVLPSLTSRLTSIGIKPSYASMLAKGQRKPSLRQAVEIEDKAGIPPRYWIHGEEPSHTSAAGNTITGASVYGLAGGEVVTRPVAAIGGGHG